MRNQFSLLLSAAVLSLVIGRLDAQEYVTKEGQLSKQLKVVPLQDGFAGPGGIQYTISPDGSWFTETVFQLRPSPKNKGKLSPKEIRDLAALLEKYDLNGLPEKTGQRPGANPHTITIEFGDKKVFLIGQMPPKLDSKQEPLSVDSRFAGIWKGVVDLLNGSQKQENKKEDKSTRTLDYFRKALDKSYTPDKSFATFGKPSRELGSGLIIYEYDLDDGSKIRLGFPGFAPIVYAQHVQGNELTVLPLN